MIGKVIGPPVFLTFIAIAMAVVMSILGVVDLMWISGFSFGMGILFGCLFFVVRKLRKPLVHEDAGRGENTGQDGKQ